MLVRGALVVLAVAVVVFGVKRLHQANACRDAKNAAIAVGLGHAPPGGADRLATKVIDNCRDSSDLAAAAAVIARGGHRAVAERLSRRAVARDPSNYLDWVALSIVLQRDQPAASRAAARRAVALNPRYAAAQQLASPAPGASSSGP
jgi:hypothetical protein